MNRISGKTFSGVEVQVDDTEFVDCEFSNCGLVYRGGMYRFDLPLQPPQFSVPRCGDQNF